MKKIFIWFFVGIVTLVSVGAGGWYYSTKVSNFYSPKVITATPSDVSLSASFETLMSTNIFFAKANKLKISRSYMSALISYKLALPSATNTAQKALIEYNIANMVAHTGDITTTVAILQQIAVTTAYPSQIRAKSVQKMGRLFHATFDPAITQEIFNKPPFKALFVSGNTILSYQNLFEYGAHIYPLPVTELYLANMYAEHIGTLYKTGATATSTSVVSDMKIIKKKFALAGASLSSTTPEQKGTLAPFTLLRKAITLGTLSHLKLASPSYAERSFKTALTAYNQFSNATSTGKDAKARYQYAAFLATTYGSSRASDIKKIMAPLYTETSYTKSPIATFFKNAHGTLAAKIGAEKNIQDIANNDPDFKAYLMTLGWSVSSFVK